MEGDGEGPSEGSAVGRGRPTQSWDPGWMREDNQT